MLNIIIPVYKGKDLLPQALDSLINQTKKMFMVTIVQDCDGEDYSEIYETYKARGLRIKWLITPENGGPGRARQYGIDNTPENVDYIMFLDADDKFMPQAVELLYREARKNQLDIIASGISIEVPGQDNREMNCNDRIIQWCHGKIYRLEYLKEHNIRFLDNLRVNEDSYFNLVAWNGTLKRARYNYSTYFWRYNPNSLTRDKSENSEYQVKTVDDYILGQIEGIMHLAEIRQAEQDALPEEDRDKPNKTIELSVPLIGGTIINIYNAWMKGLHVEKDMTKYIDDMKIVGEIIKDYTNDSSFWQFINQNLRASDILNGELYFYDQKFNDWFKEWND